MDKAIPRVVAVAILAASTLVAATGDASARIHHRRHHHREVLPSAEPPFGPQSLADGNAYRSGYAFGLLDLGISGAPSAISPYAGFVRPGYDGPGFGYPGY